MSSFLTWVQLLRNLLCVAKTLSPPSLFFLQPFWSTALYPINQILLIDYFIAVTQFIPVLFFISASISSISGGIKDFRRYNALLVSLDKLSVEGGSRSPVEYTILRQSIQNDAKNARIRQCCGIWELILAICFIFFVQNTLHFHGSTHPHPLFNALFVMELAVLYFLTLMWSGFKTQLQGYSKSQRLQESLKKLQAKLKESSSPKRRDYSAFRVLQVGSENGYFDNLMELYQILDPDFAFTYRHSKLTNESVRQDLGHINIFFTENEESENKVENKVVKASLTNKLTELEDKVDFIQTMCYKEMWMKLAVFCVNLIAFYGYMMAIFSFKVPQASLGEDSSHLQYFSKLWMLNLSADTAMYYGVLAGDLAWTVEPVLNLFVFPYFRRQVGH
jgi:hypothetical protein